MTGGFYCPFMHKIRGAIKHNREHDFRELSPVEGFNKADKINRTD